MGSSRIDIEDLIRRLRDVEAKEQIRDVLYRYARAIDRRDLSLLKSCYCPDGIDAHVGSFVGPAFHFAEDMVGGRQLGELSDHRHYVTNPMIEVEGNRAFVESSFLVTFELKLRNQAFADGQSEGRYLDIFHFRGEDWRIWRRLMIREKLIWRVRPEQPATVNNSAGLAANYPDDPIYRRFGIAELLPPEFVGEDRPWESVVAFLSSVAEGGKSDDLGGVRI